MEIKQCVLDRINVVEGEETTENIDILYEFLLDQGYTWLRRNMNYFHSSEELANDIKYIIEAEISNLDFKYCMEYLGIDGRSIDEDKEKGVMYYPISEQWYWKMKKWSNERKDKLELEEKYKKMKEEIEAGTSNYIAI